MELQALHPDPMREFELWLNEAKAKTGLEFPNSMSLATATASGTPSLRVVLLKGLDEKGFLFFTNYESRKARELAANPRAAACFYWEKTHRQVRVEGRVEKVSQAESQEYFDTRPRESRIGAWASPQSQEISSRAELEQHVAEAEERFRGQEKIPLPPHWGGYRLVPERIEFWINGPNRLHDRFLYEAVPEGWKRRRLAP